MIINQQSWVLHDDNHWQCQQEPIENWRACLYQTEKGEALLAAFRDDKGRFSSLTLWRWGRLQGSKLLAVAHGWLDYCPLKDKNECNLPD